MLPAEHRLRSSALFARTVKRGVKKGSRTVVVYVDTDAVAHAERSALITEASTGGPRVGVIVSKAVGNAVARHRVSRLLRHAATEVLGQPGAVIVIRALPASAEATYGEISKDISSCVRRALAQRRAGGGS